MLVKNLFLFFGIALALIAVVSFVVAWFILRLSKVDATEAEFEAAKKRTKDLKAGK